MGAYLLFLGVVFAFGLFLAFGPYKRPTQAKEQK